MRLRRTILILLLATGLSARVFSYSPYLYSLGIYVYRYIESGLTIEFELNSSRKAGLEYGEGEDNFLHIYYFSKYSKQYNKDGTYYNRIIFRQSHSGHELFNVNHSSKDFVMLDAVSQLRFLFREIALYVNDRKYLIDLEKLDDSALDLVYHHQATDERTAIFCMITEEFLSKYCTLEEVNADFLKFIEYSQTAHYSGVLMNSVAYHKLKDSDGYAYDNFGRTVSLDGDYALVGAYEDFDGLENTGSAYILERDTSGNWSQMIRLTASDRSEFDDFGSSVSLDGDYALVGATNGNEKVYYARSGLHL